MNEQEPCRSESSLFATSPDHPLQDLGLLAQLEEFKSLQIELELQVHELQAKQQESELLLQHYSSLFDSSPIRFVCLDHLGRIRQVNQAAATLLEGERSQLLGAYLTQYLMRDDRDKLRRLLRQARPEGAPVTASLRLRRRECVFQFLAQGLPHGDEAEPLCQVAIIDTALAVQAAGSALAVRPVETPAAPSAAEAPVPAPSGDQAVVHGHAQAEHFIAKLIKGLQVPQEHLQAQVQLVRAWLEGMPEGVMLCDAQGKILFINSSAAFLLADLIENTPVISHAADCWEDDLFYQADRQTPCTWEAFPMRRVLAGETLHREKLWISRTGGHARSWLLISGSPLRDHQGGQCGAAFLISKQGR